MVYVLPFQMSYEEATRLANQIAAGDLTLDSGPTVRIPRDVYFDRKPTTPVVVVQLINADYFFNPRLPSTLLVIEQHGRVYTYYASHMVHARFRVSRGVVSENNVMVRRIAPPLFQIAGYDSESSGIVLKYETLVQTTVFPEELVSAEEADVRTLVQTPATFYFRSNMSPQSQWIIRAPLRPIGPGQPPKSVYNLPIVVSNRERRINQGRLAGMEMMRGGKMRFQNGRVALMPKNAKFAFKPFKGQYPCILIMMMNTDFTTMMVDNERGLFGVFVIVPGASINLAVMDDDTWIEWAHHRDSTYDRTIIYHRMADGVAGVSLLRLAMPPDPEGRAIVEMQLSVRVQDRAVVLPLANVEFVGSAMQRPGFAVLPPVEPDYLASQAQLFFPVVLDLERTRKAGIYRFGRGGAFANNLFIFDDVVIPTWGAHQWQSQDILGEMLPSFEDPEIPDIPGYLIWMREKWETVRPDLGPLLSEVAVAYISPSQQYVLVAHSGQRTRVSPLLFYALRDVAFDFVNFGDVAVHPDWAGHIHAKSSDTIEFEQPVGEIVARSLAVPAEVRISPNEVPPTGSPGALSDIGVWHARVRDAYWDSDIDNLSLLHDIAMGVETDQRRWTLISVAGDRLQVTGMLFHMVFVFAHLAARPFVSMAGMFFQDEWLASATIEGPNSIRFREPIGLVKTRQLRSLAENKRLRGEAPMQ